MAVSRSSWAWPRESRSKNTGRCGSTKFTKGPKANAFIWDERQKTSGEGRRRCTSNLACQSSSMDERHRMKTSLLKTIATDLHFWVPVAVLIAGFALLLVLK